MRTPAHQEIVQRIRGNTAHIVRAERGREARQALCVLAPLQMNGERLIEIPPDIVRRTALTVLINEAVIHVATRLSGPEILVRSIVLVAPEDHSGDEVARLEG